MTDGREVECDAVILACGVNMAKQLLETVDEDLAKQEFAAISKITASFIEAGITSKPMSGKHAIVDSNKKMLTYAENYSCLEPILMDGLKFVKDKNLCYEKCLLKEIIHHFSQNEIYQVYQGIYNQLTEDGTVLTITRNQETEYPFFTEAVEKWREIQPPIKLFIEAQKICGFEVTLKEVNFKIHISKKDWVDMLKNRFWSHLSEFDDDCLNKGITEIEERYKGYETISFNDCLIFLIGYKC